MKYFNIPKIALINKNIYIPNDNNLYIVGSELIKDLLYKGKLFK